MIAFDFPPREIIWPKACCDATGLSEGRLVRTVLVNFSDGSCFSAKLVRVPPPPPPLPQKKHQRFRARLDLGPTQ